MITQVVEIQQALLQLSYLNFQHFHTSESLLEPIKLEISR